MQKIPVIPIDPVRQTLPSDPEVYVIARPASMLDDEKRSEVGFNHQGMAPALQVIAAECWIAMVECNLEYEDGKKVFSPGMTFEAFVAAMTALWRHDARLVSEIHAVVRAANPHWDPSGNV